MRSRVSVMVIIALVLALLMIPNVCNADKMEDFVCAVVADVGKDGAWYGYDSGWCARVVKYWANQAGLGESVPTLYSAPEMGRWFHENGSSFALTRRDLTGEIKCWTAGGWVENLPSPDYSFFPQSGDIVFLETDGDPADGMDRIGVCVSVTSDFQIDVAEGDVEKAGNTVQINSYNWRANDSGVWGFARLQIEDNGTKSAEAGEESLPTEFICGKYKAIDLGDGTCEISRFNSGWYGCYAEEYDLSIPETLEGKRVVSIGSNAFVNGYDGVEKIIIPEGVTRIADSAFRGVDYLKSVELPRSLLEIEGNPFDGCRSLSEIILPDENEFFRMEDGFLIDEKNKRLIIAVQPKGDIELPPDVVAIGDRAFYGCTDIRAITISDQVTSIGSEAFCECTDISSITIPGKVTSIGSEAFYGCLKLKHIELNEGLISLGTGAFACCDSLVELFFPANLSIVDGNPVYGCNNLKSIVVSPKNTSLRMEQGELIDIDEKRLVATVQPQSSISITEGVVSIGDFAFYGCVDLSSVIIPEGVTYIGNSAFEMCENLNSAIIPDGVTYIGNSAFEMCENLNSAIIPDGVTYIGASAFMSCENLTGVSLPDGLKSIGDSAFYGCYNIDDLIIPEGVTYIGSFAFSYCSLKRIVLPASLRGMGDNPFLGNWGIKSISIPAENTSFKAENGMLIDTQKMKLILVCQEKESVQIPEGIRIIGTAAFSYHVDMKHIDLPRSLECIESVAFYYSGLECIDIPRNVKSIEDSAFFHCKDLLAINLPEGLEFIGDSAFEECYELRSVILPQSLKSIGDHVFKDTEIQSVTFLGKELRIGFSIFAGTYTCPSEFVGYTGTFVENLAEWNGGVFLDIEKVIRMDGYRAMKLENGTCEIFEYEGNEANLSIPEELGGSRVISIGEGAFEDHEELCSVTLPESITCIGEYAFAYCDNLSKVVLPKKIEIIGKCAFLACDNLRKLFLPEGVVSLGEGVFHGSGLSESIIIPGSVTSIGSGAFAYCHQLNSVTLPKSLTYIGDNPFECCENLKTITIHPESTWLRMEENFLIDTKEKRLITAIQVQNSVSISEGVASIGARAFSGCNLEKVVLPLSVTRIEDSAFRSCKNLVSVEMAENTECLVEKAFWDCDNLKDITYYAPAETETKVF